MSLFGDIASGILGGANTIYNLYTNKRDFDYQKALQQQIFEREDNAVQRRMADLEAAGINPNLAAGSSAGAGSVVARSSTNDVNMGTALDTLMAKRQLEQQKEQTKGIVLENSLLSAKLKEQNSINQIRQNEADISFGTLLKQLGVPTVSRLGLDSEGNYVAKFYPDHNKISIGQTFVPYFSQVLDTQLANMKNAAALLQKDLDTYDMNKAIQWVNAFMPNVNFGLKYGIK